MERTAKAASPDAQRGAAAGASPAQARGLEPAGHAAPPLARWDSQIHASPKMAAQRRRMAGGGGVVQREVENAHYDKSDAQAAELASKFFQAYNTKAQLAYQFAVTVPSLGARANLNGYTQLWSSLWADHLAGKRPKLLAAAFGYVIESLVTYDNDFKPAAPPGCTVLPQVVSGGTRPDLVLVKGGSHVAWLDLTASGSADHIFDKEDWGSKIRHFAEVTYPSLDLATLALMKQNKDNKGALSQEEFELRQKAAAEEYLKNKTRWYALGETLTVGSLKDELAAVGLASPGTRALQPEKPREFIRKKLVDTFGVEIDTKLVPSILVALGVGGSAWGFNLGFSQSEKAGEAWLIDHAPQAD